MSDILINSTPPIDFVLVDASGVEVIGLGSIFTVEIKKNDEAFVTGIGTKSESGLGWYRYIPVATETNMLGPLIFAVSGAGTSQQNLLYKVVGAIFEPGEGSYILTSTEAATVLRCEEDDPNMLMLLPAIDAYILQATGRDWASDSPIQEEAKSAARMLLVMWHENPAMLGSTSPLNFGLLAALTQLEALALRYRIFEGLNGSGYIYLPGLHEGDTVSSVTGIQGISGDQAASFETVISINGYLRQLSSNNLDEKFFKVLIIPLESL